MSCIKNALLIFVAAVFCGNALSWDENILTEGKEFGASMNSSSASSLPGGAVQYDGTDLDFYQGENVPEKDHYESGLALESEGIIATQSSEAAELVFNNNAQRISQGWNPLVENSQVDPDSDPLFSRYDEVIENSVSLTDDYTGCVQLPVGNSVVTQYSQCPIYGAQVPFSFTCTTLTNAACKEWSTKTVMDPGVGLAYTRNTASFVLTLDLKPYPSQQKVMMSAEGDYSVKLGISFHPSIGQCEVPNWYVGGNFGMSLQITDPNWPGPGLHPISSDTHVFKAAKATTIQAPNCGNNWIARVLVEALNVTPGEDFYTGVWMEMPYPKQVSYCSDFKYSTGQFCRDTNNVPVSLSSVDETFISSQCLESGNKEISGGTAWASCWNLREEYTAMRPPEYTKSPACLALEQDKCYKHDGVCVNYDYVGDFCAEENARYACTSPHYTQLCGDDFKCPDGNCVNDVLPVPEDATEDFVEVAVGMAVVGEVASQHDPNSLKIFSGKALKCKKTQFAFSDCCKDSGWGLGIGIAHCGAEEKELGMAKEAGATIYIGSYKSGNIFDERTYKVYCSYGSLVSRVIAEESLNQLGKGLGSPKNPDCSGLLLEEIGELDFTAMDFTEIEESMVSKYSGSGEGIATIVDQLSGSIDMNTVEQTTQQAIDESTQAIMNPGGK